MTIYGNPVYEEDCMFEEIIDLSVYFYFYSFFIDIFTDMLEDQSRE